MEKAKRSRLLATLLTLLAAASASAGAAFRTERLPQGNLYVPENANRLTPKVLVIDGGAWRARDRASAHGLAETFAARGAIAYDIDCRPTAVAPWTARGDDCLAAAATLSAWRTNTFTEAIFTIGSSAGGYLSLMTGLRFDRCKVAGVISLSGVGDPTAHVSSDSPDVLLTHPYFDEVAPIASAKNFETVLRDAGACVETYYYDLGREKAGPAIEERVWRFITERFGKDALQCVGKVRTKSSREISNVSTAAIGFEGLDRHLFDPEPCYDKLAETGVKRARVQTGWCLCEPAKNVYDFSELDAVVSNLTVRGIEPWLMIGYGNTNWMGRCYTSAAVGCMPLYYGPECQAAWERFAARLAARYARQVRFWEIWNEPDIASFWQPRKPNAADYARLVKLTGDIIRREAPGAKIGGVCSTVMNDWEREAARLSAPDIDFWCVHAYGVLPELARGTQRDPNGSLIDYCGQIAELKCIFAKAGRPDIEVWQGEAGFPSWFKADHWLLGENREGFGCQEWQAKWLLRRFLTDRRAGCASTSFYQAADICRAYSMAETTQAHPAEHGLLDSRRGYVRKASHRAFAVYNTMLAEAKYVFSRKIGEVLVDEFEKDGRRLITYYRGDNLLDNRPATTWSEGERVLPSGGVLTDLMTGRVYMRPVALPLRDYPILWKP